MDYRRANRAFLYMILASISFVAIYTAWYTRTGRDISVVLNNFLSEAIVLLPALAVVLFSGDSLKSVIPLRRIKVSSVALTVVYAILLFPIATFASSLSMLFVENRIEGMADQIVSMPMWQILLSVGVFGPFVEEIIFRGIMLNSYQRTGRIVASIVLSSLLFGIVHMNFSQFTYGFILGIMLALLFEATGSVLTSFIAHGVFNSIEVIMMFTTRDYLGDELETITRLEADASTLSMIGIYFVVGVICTAIALCIIYKMADLEGRQAFIDSILKRKVKSRIVSLPLVIAIVIAIAFMIGIEALTRLSGF